MARGKAAEIALSEVERVELESLARCRSTSQGLALRARIVLAAADGGHNGLIAERLTSVAGSSRYFLGGAIVYSNDLKAQYDTAKRFITLGEQALREQNVVFAATLADKAAAIATLLLRR